jgi:hypothetical protein
VTKRTLASPSCPKQHANIQSTKTAWKATKWPPIRSQVLRARGRASCTRVDAQESSTDVISPLRLARRHTPDCCPDYQPIRELTKSGPPLCDLADAASVESHQAFSCPDRALTAFCQLGALRLQTRRCMMFFFDSQYAYVLAEATRTLSLQDDSVRK